MVKLRESFTLLEKMIKKWVPAELQSSRDLQKVLSVLPESIFGTRRLPTGEINPKWTTKIITNELKNPDPGLY